MTDDCWACGAPEGGATLCFDCQCDQRLPEILQFVRDCADGKTRHPIPRARAVLGRTHDNKEKP